MTYSKPMQILVDEHDVILSVLDAIEVVSSDDSRAFDARFYEMAADFVVTFADRCHHAKEEDLLFPALEACGIPRQQGPIGCMLHEHEDGRNHIRAIRASLPSAAQGNLAQQALIRSEALSFVALLRQHIQKENMVLFVMGDRQLTAADKQHLEQQFAATEGTAIPAGTHEKYQKITRELRQMAGVGDRHFTPATGI